MDLLAKIRTLPTSPGCYLYKNAEGEVIYVGKAKNLRARVRSYFLEASQMNAKNRLPDARSRRRGLHHRRQRARGACPREQPDKAALAAADILLRDDKTYPYIKLTLTGTAIPKSS